MKRKDSTLSCRAFCDEEVANVVIPLHTMTGCDSNSGFYGHGKKPVYDKVSGDSEARDLLMRCGENLDIPEDVMCDMKSFVLKYVYGDKKSSSPGEARVFKWKSQKKKSFIGLPPDHDSLEIHCIRANYLAYIQRHFDMTHHPSPLGHGWQLVDGRCRPVRYTQPSLPSELSNTVDDDSNSDNTSDESDVDSDSDSEASSSDSE